MDKKNQDDGIDEWACENGERLEGLNQVRKFLDPTMSMRTFFRKHRRGIEPYLLQRTDYWRKNRPGGKPRPRYFSYKRLILLYMIRRRII